MIPIRDHNSSGKFPLINYLLIITNSLVFIYMFSLPQGKFEAFVEKYALIPALILQGKNLLSVFTSMFLHGSLGHILGNMLFLNIFGDNLEDRLGHFKYLFFYFLCGLGAAGLQIIIDPQSEIPNLGASGAIAGAMGGYLLLFPYHKVDVLFSFGWTLRKTVLPAYSMLVYWFLAQFLYGIGDLGLSGQEGGVAYFAHIGGFLTGAILVFLFTDPQKSQDLYNSSRPEKHLEY